MKVELSPRLSWDVISIVILTFPNWFSSNLTFDGYRLWSKCLTPRIGNLDSPWWKQINFGQNLFFSNAKKIFENLKSISLKLKQFGIRFFSKVLKMFVQQNQGNEKSILRMLGFYLWKSETFCNDQPWWGHHYNLFSAYFTFVHTAPVGFPGFVLSICKQNAQTRQSNQNG